MYLRILLLIFLVNVMFPDKFYGKKVLAIFPCGSFLYELNGEKSDKDYTVILQNFKEVRVYKEEGVDYFLYGLEAFKKALHFDNSVLDYHLLWMDNTLIAKEHLLYIDESFVDEFNHIINIDWDTYLMTWLRINVEYYTACLDGLMNEKSLYNLYRVRSLMVNFEKIRKFTYYLSEEDRALIHDFKNKRQNISQHYKNFKEILEYLGTFLRREK